MPLCQGHIDMGEIQERSKVLRGTWGTEGGSPSVVLGDLTAASPFRDLVSTHICGFHDKILIRETGKEMNDFHSCSTRGTCLVFIIY